MKLKARTGKQKFNKGKKLQKKRPERKKEGQPGSRNGGEEEKAGGDCEYVSGRHVLYDTGR